MKIIYTILLICCFSSVFAQHNQTVIIYDGNGNVIGGNHIKSRPPDQIILSDSLTKVKFVLDTSHVYITAYISSGNILWKTDPWKDNHIEVYRTNRPVIVNMQFGINPGYPDIAKKGEKVIWIQYINTQAGFIDLKHGTFYFSGQD
jgi:hypothetical protein